MTGDASGEPRAVGERQEPSAQSAGPRPEAHERLPSLHGRLLNVSRLATIGEMAAGVAHELNQPLTAIANYAQACDRLLGRPDTDPAELHQALREIVGQAARAGDIIRRLRQIARSQQSEHTPAHLNTLVNEILPLMQTDARVHGVELSLELAEGLPAVIADPGQIQQVILNFVRNGLEALAAQASGARRLQIRTSLTAQGEIELAVLDNGPGLAPGMEERVFDPFFSTKLSGTGLGLAISNTIARDHGGSIGHRPNAPAGACFYIRLPAQSR